MTPVLVLFTVFPDSEMSVKTRTISAGGAVALFVWIWYRGTRLAINAARLDEVEQELREANKRCEISQGTTPIRSFDRYTYRIKEHSDRQIGIATGDLARVKGFDIWTNSENTNMRMAGIYERSISATIRYLGSEVDKFGDPVEDTIMEELRKAMGERSTVDPHTVLVTNAGRLAETHGVKCILHVAASTRQRRDKSHPVHDIENCVLEALKTANNLGITKRGIRSILLPLFGTGRGKDDLVETVGGLIETAIEYLRKEQKVSIPEVYFLAWSEADLMACRTALQASQYVIPEQ
jgi:O-acetyl-ADP-ribose deacetylase (regulator of RNase III)